MREAGSGECPAPCVSQPLSLRKIELRLFPVLDIEMDPDPIEKRAIVGAEGFSAAEEPPVHAGSVPSSKARFARGASLQAIGPDASRFVDVVRMQEGEKGVPRGAGLDTESQRMVARETEVIRATRIDEGEPAGRCRVPGVGRNLVEGGLQLRLERCDVRDVNHEPEIYGTRQPLAIANALASPGRSSHHRRST